MYGRTPNFILTSATQLHPPENERGLFAPENAKPVFFFKVQEIDRKNRPSFGGSIGEIFWRCILVAKNQEFWIFVQLSDRQAQTDAFAFPRLRGILPVDRVGFESMVTVWWAFRVFLGGWWLL